MNIYKGLLFLEGFRVPADDVDDLAVPAAPTPVRPSQDRAPVARSGWRRTAHAIAVFAGVVAPVNPQGRCG